MFEKPYDARDWYWTVADTGQLYASARNAYIEAEDEIYLAWVASGGVATVIASAAELDDVLARHGKSLGKADTPAAAIDRILSGKGTRDDMAAALIGIAKTMAAYSGKTVAQTRADIIGNWPSRS